VLLLNECFLLLFPYLPSPETFGYTLVLVHYHSLKQYLNMDGGLTFKHAETIEGNAFMYT